MDNLFRAVFRVIVACIFLVFLNDTGLAQSSQVLWGENWEGDWTDSWSVDEGTWEIGTPTSGPENTLSGERSAATILDGEYSENRTARLIRGASFMVPGSDEYPRLRWWHWYSFEDDDSGRVQVRVEGGDWEDISEVYTESGGKVWSRAYVDLSPYAGSTIQVAFYFKSRKSGLLNEIRVSTGWYIDNIVVLTGDPVVNNPEGWETGIGDWYVDEGTWEVGVPTSGPASARSGTRVASTVLAGDYLEKINSRLTSPVFVVPGSDDNPRLRLWHWYSFEDDDAGWVQIKVRGGEWEDLSAAYTRSSDGAWVQTFFDLSPYAGSTVQLGFYFRSRKSDVLGGLFDETRVSTGWYIDDIEIEVSGPTDFPQVETPGAPLLVAPEDGAANQLVEPTLSWIESERAADYAVQVDDDADFSSPVLDQAGIAGTAVSAGGLEHRTTYYWRVQAVNSSGASPWSRARSFTTMGMLPLPPLLALPENGAVDASVEPSLQWHASREAASYAVQVAAGADFVAPAFEQNGILDTLLTFRGLEGVTTYYWRVRAVNQAGESDWSQVWQFTTMAVLSPPATPALVAPVHEAVDQSVELKLEWDSALDAENYRVQVDNDADFPDPVVDETGVSSTSLELSQLDSSFTYYWRVRAVNQAGESNWSQVWQFTTIAPVTPTPVDPPLPPVLASPADGEEISTLSPMLEWNAVSGADSYQLQVSTSADFTGLVADPGNTAATSFPLNGLDDKKVYLWRVRAENDGGTSDWSEVSRFTTALPDTLPPRPPLNLAVRGLEPGGWSGEAEFELRWDDPEDESGIARVHYKLGSEPTTSEDRSGSFSGSGPIAVEVAREGEQRVYIWLEDGEGNADHARWAAVELRYDTTPPQVPAEARAWVDDSRALALEHGIWYDHPGPYFEWSEAGDNASGIAGYAAGFSRDEQGTLSTEVVQQERAYQAGDLGGDGTYHLRVRAVDRAGNWSAASTLFTYRYDAMPPLLKMTPVSTQEQGVGLDVSVEVEDAGEVETVVLHYKEGGERVFTAVEMTKVDELRYRSTIPGDKMSSKGAAYYVRATDSVGHVATEPEDGEENPRGIQVLFQDMVAAALYPVQVWKMASVPARPDNGSPAQILAQLGAYDATQWRLYRFFAGTYHEYLQESIGRFEPGQAFWLHTRVPGLELRSGSGRTSLVHVPFEIQLEPGWNDIADPFVFPVRWDDVMAASANPAGISGPYTYDGTSWSFPASTDQIKPWEGYAVKNASSGSVALRIPPLSALQSAASALKPLAGGGWALQVVVEAAQAGDVNNFLGFRRDAELEWDPWDMPEPPRAPGAYLRLYFPHREWAVYADVYTSDFRPHADAEVWEFEVEGEVEEAEARLSFEGVSSLPSGLQAHLLDVDGRVSMELDESTTYPVALGKQNTRRRFRIAVGETAFLEKVAENFRGLPVDYELSQSWPNPFNAATTIAYQVPEQGRIRLVVYDVLGRQVKVLEEGMRGPGYFSVVWDGRDESGGSVGSGVFLYVLETQRARLVRKMVVVQ